MLEPFLKWPGGKRWLASGYADLFPSKEEYVRYVEPFLGGGAVFFALSPSRALLTDANIELVNAYKRIKSDAAIIHRRLQSLHKRHTGKLYYEIREKSQDDKLERAIQFIYLNRTCFNGIYRVNLRGKFNVPMGTKTQVEYPSGYLSDVAARLRSATLEDCDFEKTINSAGEGDFLFVDPPYTVMHNNNNFVKYNARLFSWQDQVRLFEAVKRADGRGALIMVSNADHDSISNLYAKFGNQHQVDRASILSASPQHRRKTTELIVTNY